MTVRLGNRRRARRVIVLSAWLAVAAAGLAACTGPSGASSKSSRPATPPASLSLTAQLPAAKSAVSSINWVLPHGEPTTIDPALGGDYSPDFVTSNLCDTLLRQNPDFTISPNLATTKQVNATTLQVTLRPGVHFWDGTTMTADDVAYSLNRIRNNPNAPANYGFQYVKSIAVADANTVTIAFTRPDELFAKELSAPLGAVVEKAFATKAGAKFGTASGGLMCSGPYQLRSWKPGNSMTLVSNPHYWNSSLQPKVATVHISFTTDSSAITQGLLSGEFDGAYELPASVIPALKDSSSGALTFGASPQSLELLVSHPGGIIANSDLRKAIFIGIDRETLASAVYHGAARANYTALATTAWDPSGAAIYRAADAKWEKANAYDPSAAKAGVRRSGYTGQTLTLGILAGDDSQSAVAQIIQQDMANIGVKLAIKQLQPLQYSNAYYEASARAGLDLWLAVNFNQVADPLEFLGVSIQKGGSVNYTNFDSPAAVHDLSEAQQTFDPTRRAQLVVAAQDLLEAAYNQSSLLNIHEISYLNKRLTGAVTAFPYLFLPSLAYLGGT